MNENLYPASPILLIDDEKQWLNSFAISLEYDEGITNVIQCTDSREALGILESRPIGLVLLDLTMPHIGGEELLPQIVETHPEAPVIILSGLNQLETAVQCMKLGAFDYFVKTTERERLLAGIRRALQMVELRRENRHLGKMIDKREALERPECFSEIITQSPKMQAIFHYLEAIAPSTEPLLITGESGTGKELIARAYHRLARPEGPLVAVNAAGLDDTVFSDTLFGHTRGAFTGAERQRAGMLDQAEGGVLFLDEIGDLSPASQVKLLRLLQEREFQPLGSDHVRRADVRFVLATNLDLESAQAQGRFRKDLYYRICAHRVVLPPLRERREDISLLADCFIAEAARGLGRKTPPRPARLEDWLMGHPFPGNIRELRAMVYDAVSRVANGQLTEQSFLSLFKPAAEEFEGCTGGDCEYPELLPRVSRLPHLKRAGDYLVDEAMRRTRGNQTAAARLLGISQPALHRRLKKEPTS